MSDEPFHNPFGALARLRRDNTEPQVLRPGAPSQKETSDPKPESRPGLVARAVVRLERKGRGGKDVTVVEQLGLNPTILARWLKDLKASLGCGGVLEDAAIILQGDHRKRLPDLLTKMGVRKITVSG